MATMNPLEQKARSSFIKGFILALLLGIIGTGAFGMLYFKQMGEEKKRVSAQKNVLVLTQKVNSGQEIKMEMTSTVKVDGNIYSSSMPTSFSELVSNFVSEQDGADAESKVKIIAKTDISEHTILTKESVTTEDRVTTKDLRKEQYNMIVLPSNLENDQTIDIRLRLPSGLDYIVLSKKKVTIPEASGESSATTIELDVTEDEILTMSAVIVDAYKITGSKLYAIKYTEPGLQEKADITYIPPKETLQLIAEDANIVQQAKNSLITYYNNYNEKYRVGVSTAISNIDPDTQKSAVETGTSTEISAQKTEREKYLQNLE